MFTRLLKQIVLVALSVGGTPAFAGQSVDRLNIDYVPKFQFQADKAAAWLANYPSWARASLKELQVFEAPPTKGLEDVSIVKIQFAAGVPYDLDGAARGSINGMAALAGVKNPKYDIRPTTVSGADARRITYESDRFDGKFGLEMLLIYDRRSNTTFQVQLGFSKRRGLNPFQTLDLTNVRTFANAVISTVSLLRP